MNIRIKHVPGFIQDGKIDSSCGRIIIYGNAIIASRSHTSDHNYLLRALASRYGIKQDKVINDAIRMYYCRDGNFMIINGVRRLDDEEFSKQQNFYTKLIQEQF